MSANKKLRIPQGDTQSIAIQVVRPSATNPREMVPASIAGATLEWLLCRDDKALAPLISKLSPTAITIVDAEAGKARLRIEASDTQREAGEYFHQLRVRFADGEIKTAWGEWISITESVASA